MLTTKLFQPAAKPGRVQRRRLTDRLTAGLKRPLTIVSAPAGFGKTTLLSDWRAGCEGQAWPLAWLSLDQGDNDPGRFWAYVLAALRTLPELRELPEELEAGAPPDQLLAPLINGLEAAAGPVALVLDDYHTIQAEAVHAAAGFLVEHMPASLRLVVLTRMDPPWPMARLRAHGLLSELRAADLRFSPSEVAEFFSNVASLHLTSSDVAALEERTEGWIAALQMAAISLDGHPDPHAFVAGFSGQNRFITDYLTEEVLARQPEPLRRFLLQTSILERLSATLCGAVTGCPDSRNLLDQIERRGLFLVPLDSERQWFRFHHLFGDLLRTYLEQTEPELIPALHSRAASWLAANDLPLEATRHSFAAGDYERTLALIEQYGDGWWAMATPAFTDLIKQLPPDVTHKSPLLCAFRAWMHCMQGETEAALALMEAIERQRPLTVDLESVLLLMRTYIAALSGNPYTISEQVLQAPERIPKQSGGQMRNTADLALALILYLDGQLDRAAALLIQAAEREERTWTTHAIPLAISRLARLWLIEGRVDEARDLCQRYLSLMQERGETRFYICGYLHAALADVLRVQGDLDGAESEAREGLRLNSAWPIPHATALPLHALARVSLARGAAREALDLLEQEEDATRGRTIPPDLVSERVALRVEAWLALGDPEPAVRWARESGLSAGDPLSFRKEIEHLALARVLLATGRRAEGTGLLARLAGAAEAAGRRGRLAEIRRLQSQAGLEGRVNLSAREREILQLIAVGRSNQEIAKALVVAVGTVKVHVHNLFQKLEVQSRTQAVAQARALHLLP
ncbi:MAG: LuxR C-terminal-related transcriptional regulator [Methanocella sp.]